MHKTHEIQGLARDRETMLCDWWTLDEANSSPHLT